MQEQTFTIESCDATSAITQLEECVLRHGKRIPTGTHLRYAVDETLPAESFVIQDGTATGDVLLTGQSRNALFAGVGQFLRKPQWRGTSRPDNAERGIYLATHFKNWYDEATLEECTVYIEDLALWGCNAIGVWFDMHHYTHIGDDAAQKKIRQLRGILSSAADCGMKCRLIFLANEGYADSPMALRADWHAGQNGYKLELNGHYHTELCPSTPEGKALILQWRDDVFQAFDGIPISSVDITPYDQGGCTCAQCAPFGANGIWKLIPECATLARRHFPGCQVVLSTWFFDVFTDGEWQVLPQRLREHPGCIDALMIHPDAAEACRKCQEQYRIPAFAMSEISMGATLPWGGYGANPTPAKLARELTDAPHLCGVQPYSEGIYEDLNKVALLLLGWNRSLSVRDAVWEYLAFYTDESCATALLDDIFALEEHLDHNARFLQGNVNVGAYSAATAISQESPWRLQVRALKLNAVKAAEVHRHFEYQDARLPDDVRKSWRWRLLLLRARIDDALAHCASDEKMSDSMATCFPEEEFLELAELYRCSDETIPCLIPPARSLWKRIIGKNKGHI